MPENGLNEASLNRSIAVTDEVGPRSVPGVAENQTANGVNSKHGQIDIMLNTKRLTLPCL